MDHLSRFYCQALWLHWQIGSTSELDDIELERAQASDSTDNYEFSRLEWLEHPDDHSYRNPPGGYLDALLGEEGFDGERFARLGNFARLAIEERDIEDRRKWILRVLAALKIVANYHEQTQMREECDCASCKRVIANFSYSLACQKWATAISRLALYVPLEVSKLSLRENDHLLRDQIWTMRADDTEDDKRKKNATASRKMNASAADCARRYREARKGDDTITLKQVVSEYVNEVGTGSVQGIIRVLNDNPEQWKDDTETTPKRH